VVDQPITWYYDPDSRMRLIQDSLYILREIWEIRKNWRNGIYAKKNDLTLTYDDSKEQNRQPTT
jgi:hypothetical protein